MVDFNLLKTELAKEPYAGLSDAEAAAAVPAVVKTPKTARITYTSLGDAWAIEDVAKFVATIAGAVAQSNPLAMYVDKLLGGPGFDAANEKTAPVAAQLVGAGFCTQEQADGVLYDISNPFGGVPAEADVTEARRQIAAAAEFMAWYVPQLDRYNAWAAAVDQWRIGGYDPATKPGDL